MDIEWLKDFEALVAQKNFSRAAEERYVSQPAFSRRIRALEEGVGVKLINRQTLPLSLTPAGEVFLSQSRVILRSFAETIDRCQTISAASENVIRFATSQSLYMTHYKTHLAPMVQEGGLDIDLNSTSWDADQFVSALQQRYCDVILTYWHPSMDFLAPLELGKCEYLTLSKDDFVLVSKAHKGLPVHDLDKTSKRPASLLSYGIASALHAVVDHMLRLCSDGPKMLTVNRSALAISVKAMILEGFGMGWLPYELCKEELADGRMVRLGDDSHLEQIEVRLYRDKENNKPTLRKLWAKLKVVHE
ncbi:LysR family transcriptional regulator [Pacificibacter sp. AS14]|uniref:LysR family transcriptional regulator n=1 Tax=Pacificibacter sp. AS14 TaxID=3135785 RepID=UPI00317AF22B